VLGRGNAWIGIQATDGADYYSNQVNLGAAATPGANANIFANHRQIYLQATGLPDGTAYFFCHAGNPSDYPTGGKVTNHGAFTTRQCLSKLGVGLRESARTWPASCATITPGPVS
jgi:hypothetical protein